LAGDVNSNGLALATSQAVVKVHKLAGRYRLSNGNLRVDAIALDLLNGRLTADAAMEHVESTPRSRIHLALTGISLQALKSSLPDLANHSVPVTGTLDATADAAWVGSPANVNAH